MKCRRLQVTAVATIFGDDARVAPPLGAVAPVVIRQTSRVDIFRRSCLEHWDALASGIGVT